MNALRIFALAAVLLACLAPTAIAKPKDKSGPAEAMADRINAIRADNGLPALKVAPKLMRSSRRFAKQLMRNDSLSHGSAYRVRGFRTTGEMLAYNRGWRVDPAPAIRMWLNSSGHRGLMLSSSFRYVGASPARGRFGRTLTTVWVVHVAAH